MGRLTADDVGALDPYAFLAVLGKRVIHPGGHAGAGLTDVRTEMGPFAMMTARGFLADEGAHAMTVVGRAISRPAYLRKMMWLMPRISAAVPYLGYVVVEARKPAPILQEA